MPRKKDRPGRTKSNNSSSVSSTTKAVDLTLAPDDADNTEVYKSYTPNECSLLYQQGHDLGVGAFAQVYLGVHRSTNRQFAIKKIDRAKMWWGDRDALQDEVAALEAVRHGPHIVTLYQVFYDGSNDAAGKYCYLVTELCRGGELFDRILEKKVFNEAEAQSCLKCILQALEYMHESCIAHRDLKPENLLMVNQADPSKQNDIDYQMQVKLADFGFAKKVTVHNGLRTLCGTPGYLAPEILERWPAYDTKCDLWSVGVILFLLLGGYLPFEDENEDKVFTKTRNGQYEFHPTYWKHISSSAKNLVTKFLTINPNKRYSASEALKHEWTTNDKQTPPPPPPQAAIATPPVDSKKSTVISTPKVSQKNNDNAVPALTNEHPYIDNSNNISASTHKRKGSAPTVTSPTNKAVASSTGSNSSSTVPATTNIVKKAIKQFEQNKAQTTTTTPPPPVTTNKYAQRNEENKMQTLNQKFAKFLDSNKDNDARNRLDAKKAAVPKFIEDSKSGRPFQDFYICGDMLGEGGYAKVYRVTHKRTRQTYAVKAVDTGQLENNSRNALRDEIAALKLLRSGPHIIRLFDVFEEVDHTYLVMEEMKGGDLLTRITEKEVYTEREARKTCMFLFQAMDYIHKKKVAHRDIKPENVLMVDLEDDHSIKLCDFGFAKRVPRPFCLRTLCGTAQYVAPEVLDLQSAGYDQRADMWSVGVVVYILLGGYAPFDSPVLELAQAICTANYCFHDRYWSEISVPAKNMISNLLQVDCTKRLTAEGALQCPWMSVEEETLIVKDLSGAQAAMKERRREDLAGDSIMATHRLEASDVSFTVTLGTFEEVARRTAKRTETEMKTIDEDNDVIEDSTSGKPFDSIYQWGKLLSEGGFSETHEARHRQTRSIFAVKRVERADLDEYAAVALQSEISTLQMVSECPYIVRLYDVFDEADFSYIVMERLKGGELIDRIGEKSCYSEEDARIVTEKVLIGLDYCHNKRIAHRNIKAENLILTSKGTYVDVKISDFSFAKRVLFPNSLTTQCGTEGYTAPEILEHRPAYDVQCDMWSLGVVLYIMLGGYRPFRGEGQEITRSIRYGEYKFNRRYWKNISEEAKILISRMLTVNPIARITVNAALQSDWITMDHSYVSDEDAARIEI